MGKTTSFVLGLFVLVVLAEAHLASLDLGGMWPGGADRNHGDGGFTGSGEMSGDGDHGNGLTGGSGVVPGDGDLGIGGMSGDGNHGNGYTDGSGVVPGDGDLGNGEMPGDGNHGNNFTSGMGSHGDGDHGDGYTGEGGHQSGDGDLGSGGMSGDSDHGNGFGSEGDGDLDGMHAVGGLIGMSGGNHGNGPHSDEFLQIPDEFDDDDDHDHDHDHDLDDDEDDDDFDSDFGQPPRQKKRKRKQSKCGDGCAKCGFFGFCRRCNNGYTKTPFMKCLKKAKKSCRLPHCQECPGASILFGSCKKCDKGWFKFKGQFSFEAKCVKKCPRGYLSKTGKSGAFCGKIVRRCPLIRGCGECRGRRTCTRCINKLYVLNGWMGSSRCVRRCPRGYESVIKNGTRVCQLEEGCKDKLCSFCKKGWVQIMASFKGRKCYKQCPSGFYQTDSSSCLKCERGCKTCAAMGECKACAGKFALLNDTAPGATMHTTTCLRRCPHGYKKKFVRGEGFLCQQVCYVANCQRCPRNGHIGMFHHCESCKPGYHLQHHLFVEKCVSQCPRGFYIEKTAIGTICRKGPRPTTKSQQITLESETTTSVPEMSTTKPETTTTVPEITTREPDTTTPLPKETTNILEYTTPRPTMGFNITFADEP